MLNIDLVVLLCRYNNELGRSTSFRKTEFLK